MLARSGNRVRVKGRSIMQKPMQEIIEEAEGMLDEIVARETMTKGEMLEFHEQLVARIDSTIAKLRLDGEPEPPTRAA